MKKSNLKNMALVFLLTLVPLLTMQAKSAQAVCVFNCGLSKEQALKMIKERQKKYDLYRNHITIKFEEAMYNSRKGRIPELDTKYFAAFNGKIKCFKRYLGNFSCYNIRSAVQGGLVENIKIKRCASNANFICYKPIFNDKALKLFDKTSIRYFKISQGF